MSVLSHSNVQILWEVLNGLISDNKLKIKNLNEFRGYFDNKCKEYHVKRFDYDGLSDINKHIVAECFKYLRKASQDSQLIMFREYEEYGNKNLIKNMQVSKRYEEHQNNFKSMINAKKPNEVDFAENTDSPIGNMGDAMSKRMEEREAELNNITHKYNQNHESIKWLNNSGDIPPKLTIHNEPVGILNKKLTISNEVNTINKEKKEKKKVKFKSDFLKNMNNEKKNDIEKEEKTDEEIKEKAKLFQDLTEQLNKNGEENSRIYLEKREIIKIIDEKDNPKEAEEKTDIMDIFSKMKIKTKESDIKGANKIDLIDLYKKIDKLEEYLVDVLKNQIDLMNQQKEILSKIKYSQINDNNDSIISSFAAI
jgi:hypothetical protein